MEQEDAKNEEDLEESEHEDFDSRQNEIKFACDAHDAALSLYIEQKLRQEQVCKLRTEIENWVKETHKSFLTNNIYWTRATDGYGMYFNYGLNTTTWRNFVNKQIMQVYTRLVIEKQLMETKKMEKDLKDRI